jgi:ketosteroid isomerase-like protein
MTTGSSTDSVNRTETSAESVVRRYYELVDAGRTGELLALFSDDVDYLRQGTPAIHGKVALRRFYEDERVIDRGTHSIDALLTDGSGWAAVRGVFRGKLRTGEDVTVAFTDWHHVTAGVIDRRESLFPGRTV